MNGFMATLRLVKDDYRWGIEKLHYGYDVQYLIRGNGKICPLSAVGRYTLGKPYGTLGHRQAGRDMGMPDWLVDEIAWASDTIIGWKPEIRNRILAALDIQDCHS